MKSFVIISFLLMQLIVIAQKPRARDIGIPFEGSTGKFNAITDVAGVEVGYCTIITGSGKKHKMVIDILKKYKRIK